MDNEAVEEQEVDIVEFLAAQGENEDDNEVDEYTPANELPTDPEELKELLLQEREIKTKRNKTLKKREQALHRVMEEQEALKSQLEELKTGSQPAQDNSAQQQEYKETLEKWRNSVAENPETSIDYMNWQMSEMQNKLVDLVANMQSGIEGQISQIRGDVDPEMVKYRDKVERLKQNPDFAEWGNDQLVKFIKATEKVPLAPRGSVSGRRATAQPSADQKLKELKAKYAEQLKNQ